MSKTNNTALAHDLACPDCTAVPTFRKVGTVTVADLFHDEGCPWFRAFDARAVGPELRVMPNRAARRRGAK